MLPCLSLSVKSKSIAEMQETVWGPLGLDFPSEPDSDTEITAQIEQNARVIPTLRVARLAVCDPSVPSLERYTTHLLDLYTFLRKELAYSGPTKYYGCRLDDANLDASDVDDFWFVCIEILTKSSNFFWQDRTCSNCSWHVYHAQQTLFSYISGLKDRRLADTVSCDDSYRLLTELIDELDDPDNFAKPVILTQEQVQENILTDTQLDNIKHFKSQKQDRITPIFVIFEMSQMSEWTEFYKHLSKLLCAPIDTQEFFVQFLVVVFVRDSSESALQWFGVELTFEEDEEL